MNSLFKLLQPPKPQRVQSNDPLASPLLWLSKNDPWTIRDACEGTAVFGATGSGKTSGSGAAIAKSFLSAGFGGLILCAKNSEVDLWKRYCREAGRSDSLIIFGPQQPYRFNFLNYELNRPGVGAGLTENLVRLFSTILEVERRRGQNGNQDFWQRTSQQLLRNCIELLSISRGRLMLQEIYDVIVTAPSEPEEIQSEAWQRTSLCWKCIQEGEAKRKTERQRNDFEHATKYFLREYAALSSRTRSIIVTNLTSMMDLFLRGTLRELFCTTTNIVPEMTHEGAVIVLDLSIKEYAEIGLFSQILFKFIWQRACERRDVSQRPRPVFLWADEAQFFVTASDAEFQSTARSSRVATVYLSQSIGAYYSQIGQSETQSLMGNLQTKFFHANGDPVTNNFSSELFSKSWQFRGSAGTSTSEGSHHRVSKSFNASDTLDFEVLPQQFTCLKKGGSENGYCVEGIVFLGGRIWNETLKNHIQINFAQR